MDKTYSEAQGIPAFDWNRFLDQAEQGKVTDDELWNARHQSNDWVTCACGNQCAALPRNENGRPLDGELYTLGLDFADDIYEGHWSHARSVLSAIESRSSFLLRTMFATPNESGGQMPE